MSGGYGRGGSEEPGRNPPKRPAIRGIYLIVGAVLAIAATVTLIVTDNPRLLKTAVIVAVWACVFALLAGSRPRRDGELSSSREEELRRTYELEIDREVAARREYELRLEVALRRELENHLKKDLGDLQAQIGALRKEMAERWNGELRLERFALRAESTRLTGTDRQMLEQQAGRLGLESPNASRTEISYDIEQGTSTLPANGRPVESPPVPPVPPLPTGRPVEAPANGRPVDKPAPSSVSQLRPPPAPDPEPEQPSVGGHDPLFGPLPAGMREQDWAPTNGGATYNGGSTYNGTTYNGDATTNGVPVEPSVPISSRRHRRRAEESGDAASARSEPTNGSPGSTPANPWAHEPAAEPPSYQDTPFRPRMPAESAGRHGREEERRGREEAEPPKRRRRYRDDDEENDVIARIRQQR
jgi:hypothetical protein